MAGFTVKTFVDAPPSRVFEAASDFANAHTFVRGITKVEMLTDGPVGVGTRFKETRVMFKRECTEEMEVTAFDAPRSYALGAESCGSRYRSELRFTPRGSGTDLEMVFDATPLTLLAKIMAFVMRPMMKKMVAEMAGDLEDIKTHVERAPGPPAAEPGARSV